MRFLPLALLCLTGAACSADPVRLYTLREAEPGTLARDSYERLEAAVGYANGFLTTSRYAPIFPAESARFEIGLTDLMVHLEGEGVRALRIESTAFMDLRTAFSDNSHPTSTGFLSGGGEEEVGADFLLLPSEEMAAVLLRQASMMRELSARGEFDFRANHALMGVWPLNGWGDDNPITARSYAVEEAYRRWMWETYDYDPDDDFDENDPVPTLEDLQPDEDGDSETDGSPSDGADD